MKFRSALVLLIAVLTAVASAQQTATTLAGSPQGVQQTDATAAPKTRMLVELFPNQDIREYNVAVKICKGRRRAVVGDLVDLQLAEELNFGEVGATGDALVAEVKKIKGVVGIDIDQYSLVVTINPAFLWDDIDPQIRVAFEKVLKISLDVHTRGSADVGGPLTFEEKESVAASSVITSLPGSPVLAGAQTRAVNTSVITKSKTTAAKKTTPVKKTTKKTSKRKRRVHHTKH